MRGGNDAEESIFMPSWMEEDVPSEDEDEVHGPNLDPEAEYPINDQEEDLGGVGMHADDLGGVGMQGGQESANIPVPQLEADLDEPLNHPGLVQHPAQQQRQNHMPTSGYPFLMYDTHGVQLPQHDLSHTNHPNPIY
jgi:hypothetical protein